MMKNVFSKLLFKTKLSSNVEKIAILAKMENLELEVLYLSKNFLVVNKCFDLVMNDNDPERFSLAKLMKAKHPDLFDAKFLHGFRTPHRLDYSTSGIVVAPLNDSANTFVSKAFQDRKVHKYYVAIARGHLQHPYIHINLGIGKDQRLEWDKIKMAAENSKFCGKFKHAETYIIVLSWGQFDGAPATKILMKPITGRRHQLRAHCDSIGHTLVGDFTYSDRSDIGPFRMFLHAQRLVVPNATEPLDICTEDPFASRNLSSYVEADVKHELLESTYQIFDDKKKDWFLIDKHYFKSKT